MGALHMFKVHTTKLDCCAAVLVVLVIKYQIVAYRLEIVMLQS